MPYGIWNRKLHFNNEGWCPMEYGIGKLHFRNEGWCPMEYEIWKLHFSMKVDVLWNKNRKTTFQQWRLMSYGIWKRKTTFQQWRLMSYEIGKLHFNNEGWCPMESGIGKLHFRNECWCLFFICVFNVVIKQIVSQIDWISRYYV